MAARAVRCAALGTNGVNGMRTRVSYVVPICAVAREATVTRSRRTSPARRIRRLAAGILPKWARNVAFIL